MQKDVSLKERCQPFSTSLNKQRHRISQTGPESSGHVVLGWRMVQSGQKLRLRQCRIWTRSQAKNNIVQYGESG
jgi:hypothetical protein